jgi:hypothetical protein
MTKEVQESIEVIQAKVLAKQTDFDKNEKLHLANVYEHVTGLPEGGGRKRVLNVGCSACVSTAMNIVHNFLMYHHVQEPTEQKTAVVKKITVQVDSLDDLTRNELIQQVKETGLKMPRNASKQQLIDLINGNK